MVFAPYCTWKEDHKCHLGLCMLKYIQTGAVTDGSLWQFLPPPVVSSPHVAPIRTIDETGCRGDGYSFRE